MSMFRQIETNEIINKIYEGPYPSGASNMPYNFGWSNKYSPKPYGLRVRPSQYSTLARSGTAYYESHRSNGELTVVPAHYYNGPVNAIYEVDISGVGNVAGGCVDGSGLNGRHYVYMVDNQQNASINSQYSTGVSAMRYVYWFGRLCNKNRMINLCNLDSLILTLGVALDTNASSGNLAIELKMPYNKATLPAIQASGVVVFRKDFGYVETVSTQSPSLLGHKDYLSRMPYMLEGEHVLSGVSDNSYGNNSLPGTIGLVDGIYGQDVTYGDFGVDLTNAYVTVRPYKSGFYDVKNTDMNFASGETYPIFATKDDLGFANSTLKAVLLEPTLSKIYNSFNFSENYYLQRGSGDYKKIIGNKHQPSGDYAFFPYHFDLRFLNVNNISSGIRDCRDCNEFYNKKKGLRITGTNAAGVGATQYDARYIWNGSAYLETRPNQGDTSFYYDYYNICDHGCNDRINNNLPRNNFTNGPCNNFIELTIVESGNIGTVGSTNTANAYLYFGAIYSSGTSILTKYSRKRLNKQLCSQNSSNKCYGSGVLYQLSTTDTRVIGLHNVFSSGFWSGPWTYENVPSDDTSRNNFLSDYLDITNYCDFSNTTVELTPPELPQTPCAKIACTICDGTHVPQTINANIQMAVYSGTTPSSYVLLSGTSRNYILNSDDSNPFTTLSYYGGGKAPCYWTYYGSGITVTFQRKILHQGYNLFQMASPYQISTYTGFISETFVASGLSTGKALDFRVDCNNDIIYDDTREVQTQGIWQKTVVSATIEFADLYDIRDYL